MFTSARLKLTAWYLVIIMTVTFVFSLMVYRVMMFEVRRFAAAQRIRIERRWGPFGMPGPAVIVEDPDLEAELRRRIIFTLVAIDTGILVISGALGYFLAGRTLAPIKNMMDEQNRFISDASHELKTPLTALRTSMEVFIRTPKPKLSEAKEVISEGLTEISRLQSLSESLLQLAQYQNTNGSVKLAPVFTFDFISSAIKKTKILADKKNLAVSLVGNDYQVKGNIYSLTDLMVILLDNAVKYSPEKGDIEIRTKKVDHSVTISVIDHGIGIDTDELPHIFDRFYRSDTARSKVESGGYGLGLSIAKKIVDSHKGTISVTSKPGVGSVFTVALPLANVSGRHH